MINGIVIAVHESTSENNRKNRTVEARYIFRAQSPSINRYTKLLIIPLYQLKVLWVDFHIYIYGNEKIHARKKVAKEQQDFVASRLYHATQSLISGKISKFTHEISDVSITSSNAPNSLEFASVGRSKSTKNVR